MRKHMKLVTMAGMLALTACGGDTAPKDEAPQSAKPVESAAVEGVPSVETAKAEMVPVAVEAPAAQTIPASNAPAVFAQCKACHSVVPGKNGIGPSLAGVFGTKAGHLEDFTYSAAMNSSGLTWDVATLDSYLKNPREAVPGTKMSYPGLKDDTKRTELIEYLKTI